MNKVIMLGDSVIASLRGTTDIFAILQLSVIIIIILYFANVINNGKTTAFWLGNIHNISSRAPCLFVSGANGYI